MTCQKLQAGSPLPVISVSILGGGTIELGEPRNGFDWQMVVVYRGKHCPMCTSYLRELNDHLEKLNELNIDLVAVSADPQSKAQDHVEPLKLGYDVAYDLSIEQMQSLGLYISRPRSPEETDRPFSEPAVFVINDTGMLQLVNTSNAPFVRPTIATLVAGLGYIRNPENNYPIRGTYRQASHQI